MPENLDFGHLVEGIVELDPMTGRYVINSRDTQGRVVSFDVQTALEALKGQEVRFTLASFDTLNKLAQLVEEGGLKIEDAVVGGTKQ